MTMVMMMSMMLRLMDLIHLFPRLCPRDDRRQLGQPGPVGSRVLGQHRFPPLVIPSVPEVQVVGYGGQDRGSTGVPGKGVDDNIRDPIILHRTGRLGKHRVRSDMAGSFVVVVVVPGGFSPVVGTALIPTIVLLLLVIVHQRLFLRDHARVPRSHMRSSAMMIVRRMLGRFGEAAIGVLVRREDVVGDQVL